MTQDEATPSQRLDAATVERDREAILERLRALHTRNPREYAEVCSIIDAIRNLATEPHQHGGKGA